MKQLTLILFLSLIAACTYHLVVSPIPVILEWKAAPVDASDGGEIGKLEHWLLGTPTVPKDGMIADPDGGLPISSDPFIRVFHEVEHL